MPNPPQAGLPNPQAYDTAAPRVVLDQVTGLGWVRSAQPGFATWTAAVEQCEGLELDGVGDFRLPSRIELVSLVDFRFSDPAIDPEAFPSTPAEMFWSSSRLAGSASDAWYVNFYFGSTDYGSASNEYRVRCVRGPE